MAVRAKAANSDPPNRTELLMLKAVFFDAAGTLFETREPVGRSYATIARDYGVDASPTEVNAAFRRAFHNAGGLSFGPGHSRAELRTLERDWWRRLVAEAFAGLGAFSDFDAYFTALFEYFADPANWRPMPDAASMLEGLKHRGLTVGIISNFDYRLYRILEGLGLAHYFDSITISSEAGYSKPSIEVFRIALDHHALSADESLHVGDSEDLDVAGANAAGMAAVLMDPDLRAGSDLSGRPIRIARLSMLLDILQGFPFP